MFDGFRISLVVNDFESWRHNIEGNGIILNTPIDTKSGEIGYKLTSGENGTKVLHRGNWKGHRITVKEVSQGGTNNYYLSIDGSLHKSAQGGANFAPFTFYDCCREIVRLCEELHIDAKNAVLKVLEFGVNIPVPFPAYTFLQNHLISHKGETFSKYNPDRRGRCLGYHCEHIEYSVKIYDKGLQNDLTDHLMRFELRYTRLRQLKRLGIRYLHDLTRPEILPGLEKLLMTAWENVLLYDDGVEDAKDITPLQREILRDANNPKYWEKLKGEDIARFNRYRRVYRSLVAEYGKGYHEDIKRLISLQWKALTEDNYSVNTELILETKNTILPIKVKGEFGTLPVNPPRSCKESRGGIIPQRWYWDKPRISQCIHDIV